MTLDPAPLPGLATDEELAAGLPVVECDLCGHPLTSRWARLRRLGDDCARKLGYRDVRRPGRFEVEQDGIPGV